MSIAYWNGWIPEWPKGTDCKSAANCFGGSNPPPPIESECFMQTDQAGVAELADAQDLKSCGTYTPVSVRFRSPALWFISSEKTPTSTSGSFQSPTSIKASGGLQRCALEICHANAWCASRSKNAEAFLKNRGNDEIVVAAIFFSFAREAGAPDRFFQ